MKNSVIYMRICAFGLSTLCAAALLAAPARAAELPDASTPPEAVAGEAAAGEVAVMEAAAGDAAELLPNEVEWVPDSPVVLTLQPEPGFRMPDVFLVKIDQTEYLVRADGQELPPGITFDAGSGKLALATELLHGNCDVSVFGAAVGARVTADLLNLRIVEDLSHDFTAEQSISLTLIPTEGFAIPGELKLILRDILYTIPTDGSNPHEGISFDPALGVLTIAPMHLRIGETVQLAAEAVCVDPVLLEELRQQQEKEEEEANKRTEIYIRVLPVELPYIAFTETASQTRLDPVEGTVLMLTAGQDLALTLQAAEGTMLPEGLKVKIQRENGFCIEEIFRFDGKENAEFLAYDPAIQELRIRSNKLLELDTVILTSATPEELALPEEEAEAEETPEDPEQLPRWTAPGSTEGQPQGSTEEQPQGSAEGQPQGGTEEQPQGSTEEQPQGDTEGQPQGSTEEQPQGDTEGQPQGTTEGQPQGTTEGQPQGTAEGQPQGGTEEQPQGSTEGQPQGSTEGQPQGSTEGQLQGTTEGQPQDTLP